MDSLRLRTYQQQAVEAVENAWAAGMLRPAAVLATGLGKAQPVDELVLTPDGWTKIGDLRVGDFVIGASGQPTMVEGVYPQGLRPIRHVTFSDGASVRCDADHLWAVRTRSDKNRGKDYRILRTDDLSKGKQPWYIPLVAPVEMRAVGLPLDPYLMGVLLGDGGLSLDGQVMVTCRDDTAALLPALLPEPCRLVRVADAGNGAATWRISGLVGAAANPATRALRSFGLMGKTAHGKFIPFPYLLGSPAQRLALLQGLCDTDGHVAPGSGWVEYVTVSEQLAQGVLELVRSLGGLTRIRTKRTTWTHNGEKKQGTAFRLNIRMPRGQVPVRVPRKRDVFHSNEKYMPTRRIVSVEDEGEQQAVCIRVAAPDHLYVTKDHVVTHNTVIFSHIARRAAEAGRGRVIVLVHRDELAQQARAKLRAVMPGVPIGLVKAEHREVEAPVVVGSVQTLARAARRGELTGVGLVIVDECHHAAARSYVDILEHYGCFKDTPAVGFTATMVRGDERGLGDIWQEVVFKRGTEFGIREGFLVDVRGKAVDVEGFDLTRIAKSRGDYQEGALGDALIASGAGQVMARAYKDLAADRQGVLFAPTVAAAEAFADDFNAAGIRTEVITGATSLEDRELIYKRARHGDTQVLSNCMVLTEGFDMPQLSCAVIARPTQSPGLYVQMAGRVLRPHPGKMDALLLDVVGVSGRLKLASPMDLSETGVAPRDGESLAEAIEREEREHAGRPGAFTGTLSVRDVDLFSRSHSAWLRTAKGVWFVPTRQHTYFLWPDDADGQFKIGKCGVYSAKGGEWLMRDLPLELAMSWAEQYAEEEDPMVSSRDASWRRKKQRPSPQQVDLAVRLRLPVTDTTTKNELSDAISVCYASKILDRAA
jgi:superfamily II DNA or RNA helicase